MNQQGHAKRPRMDLSVFWSSLPGVPKKVKWPVKVEEWSESGKPLVYCRCDNAYFKVSRDQLVPFPGPFDKLKGQGAAILTRKKKLTTLTAFHQDVEWAVNHLEAVTNDTDTNVNHLEAVSNDSGTDVNHLEAVTNNTDTDVNHLEAVTNDTGTDVNHLEAVTNDTGTDVNHLEAVTNDTDTDVNHLYTVVSGTDTVGNLFDTVVNDTDTVVNHLYTATKDTDTVVYHLDTVVNDTDTVGYHIDTVTNDTDTVVNHIDTVTNDTDTVVNHIDTVTNDTDNDVDHLDTVTNDTDTVVNDLYTVVSGTDTVGNLFDTVVNDTDTVVNHLYTATKDTDTVVNHLYTATKDTDTVVYHFDTVVNDTDTVGNHIDTVTNYTDVVNHLDTVVSDTVVDHLDIRANATDTVVYSNSPDAMEKFSSTSESSDEFQSSSDEFVPDTSESSDESDTWPVANNVSGKQKLLKVKTNADCSHSKHVGVVDEKKMKCRKKSFTHSDKSDLESELSSNSDSCPSDGTSESEKENLLSESGKRKKFEYKNIDEKFKVRDTSNPHIYVRKLRTSKYHGLTGIRKKSEFVWNQVHCCKFCEVVRTNIAKHYQSAHRGKKEVVEVMELSKQRGAKDKIVRAKWDILRQEGDHNKNMEVLDLSKGEFIVSRRQHDRLDVSRYGPCPSCLAWLRLEKTMFRHRKTCPAIILGSSTDFNVSAKELRIRSLGLAGKLSPLASPALKNEVFPIMTNDNISSVAQEDPLIVALGNLWLSKNIGNRLKRKYYTSSRMRGAARLLMNARQVSGHDEYCMHNILVTEHFDDLVKAALMTASPEIDDFEDLKSPSTAIKLGYDIKRMLGAKWAQALKEKSSEDKREAKDVFKLMEIEWSIRVTKLASTILQVRKFNMEKSLPEPSDLVDLNKHVKEEIKLLDLTDSSPPAFQRACRLAESRILLYNKRRSGEVEGIRVKEYVKRQRGISNIDKAMRCQLSTLEKKLLESQDLLETRGKYGRGVPVILPPDLRDVLHYLTTASIRTKAARLSSNRYVFANTRHGVMRAYDSLKTMCSEVNLIKPDKITSVNLRKYTATISQVFNLNDQEQSWLVNHLGHSMDIHKIHYRQTSGTIERIDISKLMLIQEFNLSSKYAGQHLDDIQLKELLFDSDKDELVMNGQQELPDEVPVTLQNEDEDYQPGLDDVADEVFDEFDFTEEDAVQPKKKKSAAAADNVIYAYLMRTYREIFFQVKITQEPSRAKLLPDPLTYPYIQPPYTLVIELMDILVHPEWKFTTGWRFKKRPGIDYFLRTVGPPTFEVVIFTKDSGMTADPIVTKIDPENFIMYRLYRDATRYQDGTHIKDLNCLNRDLSRVIMIDWNKDTYKLNPDNGFSMKKWTGDMNDTALGELAEFLSAIAASKVDDVRPVLRYYNQFDNPMEQFHENQRKLKEEQERQFQAQQSRDSRSLTSIWNKLKT